MLSPIEIVDSPAQAAAVIVITIPRDMIQTVMGAAIEEVIAAATTRGIGPIGPVFAHHFDMQPGVFHFEVGVPVSEPIEPVGRVKPGLLPASTVVRTIYTGPYEGLGEAWGEFTDAVEAAGHATATNLWERYLSDPATTPNPADYQTELNRPLL